MRTKNWSKDKYYQKRLYKRWLSRPWLNVDFEVFYHLSLERKKRKLTLQEASKIRRLSRVEKITIILHPENSEHYSSRIKSLQQSMLNNPGHGEVMFEKILRLAMKTVKKLSYRRQHPFAVSKNGHSQWFFLDFFLPKRFHAIEIDGSNHKEPYQSNWDKWRTNFLRDAGITVIRFTSKDVINNPYKVYKHLIHYFC